MNNAIKKKIQNIYNDVLQIPNTILGIFNDYFGEDNVDMQGFNSLDDIYSILRSFSISSFCENHDYEFYNTSLGHLTEEEIEQIPEEAWENIRNFITTVINKNTGVILVHWPTVRITNENDRFIDITHLYAKVLFSITGRLTERFTLNRAEYPLFHLREKYLHSHVSSIPIHDFTQFQYCCLGMGPIAQTQSNLQVGYNEDRWKLFVRELDQYVHVESLSGGPYHKLESLGAYSNYVVNNKKQTIFRLVFSRWDSCFTNQDLKDFTKFLLQDNGLKFKFTDNNYDIGMTFVEFVIYISNKFIEWWNLNFPVKTKDKDVNALYKEGFLYKAILCDDKIFYGNKDINTDYSQYQGAKICTFKGKNVTLNIINDEENLDNRCTIINPRVAYHILTAILSILNFKYGKQNLDETITVI